MFLLLLNCNHTAYTIILVSLIVTFADGPIVDKRVFSLYDDFYLFLSLQVYFLLRTLFGIERAYMSSISNESSQAIQELGGGWGCIWGWYDGK